MAILTVTLNPSLDLTTSVAHVYPGEKLRCSIPLRHAGGGGINVSRALKILGGESDALIAIGGAAGDILAKMLQVAGINTHIAALDGDTRTSFMVRDQKFDQQYRFILPGPHQSPEVAARLLRQIADVARQGDYRFVVLSGSLLPGLPEDFYAKLVSILRITSAKLIIDTSGPPLKAAFSARPFLVKANGQEAKDLLGLPNIDAENAAEIAQEIRGKSDAPHITIVTMGKAGALVVSPRESFLVRAPMVTVKSSVGAGDCFVAAATFALLRGWALQNCACLGVAAAASAMATEASELCERDQTQRFFQETKQMVDAVELLP